MTTDIEMTMTNDIASDPANRKPTGIGARLKAAREAMHLSEKEAAARLHLNPKLIVIMEAEDFGNGLPATFVRGYIRSYGRLLNLPVNELDAAIEQLGIQIPATTTPIVPKLHTPLSNNNERYVQWLTYIIILVLVALVGIWWNSHPIDLKPLTKLAPAPATPAAAAPAPTPAAPVANTVTAPANLPTNMPITAQPPVNSTTKATPQIADPQTPTVSISTPTVTAIETDTTEASPAAQAKSDKTKHSTQAQEEDDNETTPTQMDTPEPGLNTSDY